MCYDFSFPPSSNENICFVNRWIGTLFYLQKLAVHMRITETKILYMLMDFSLFWALSTPNVFQFLEHKGKDVQFFLKKCRRLLKHSLASFKMPDLCSAML